MGSLEIRRRHGMGISAARLIPTGSFAVLGLLAALPPNPTPDLVIAGLMGLGAFFSGKRLLDRQANRRKELRRRAASNVRELGRVAREDRVAASQMKRLMGLQSGLLESWELLPEEYRPLLDDDIFTIVGEVEGTARLARRRMALRRHLQSQDRREIEHRIESLERDIGDLEPGSQLRTSFEMALDSRRDELDRYGDLLNGISMINAQLESAESLLGGLRGELLALDTSLTPGSLESGLVHLKERVAYFRRGLDEVTRSVETLPEATTTEVRV